MRGRGVQAAAEAFAISRSITEALTAIMPGHRSCGSRPHIPRWCRRDPARPPGCGWQDRQAPDSRSRSATGGRTSIVTVGPPVDGGTVLITGASSGIGREFAAQLAARAGTLIVVARRAGLLEGLRAELIAAHPRLQVVALPVDLSDEDDVDRRVAALHEQVGAVDILINNAGLGDQALFDVTDWTRTRQILHTNVVGVVQLTTLLVPSMVERGRGGVLNVGSGAGLTVMPASAAYSASKHFINGFSEALRADLAGTGVVVTQVCPGPVDSEFDTVAGSAGGMAGGPPPFLRISAARCAREALAGFDAGKPLVFPGRAYRIAMRALPLLPRPLQRRQAASAAARVRSQALHAVAGSRSAHAGIPEKETPA